MRQIAILGGTFDPIHNGHLIGGQYVKDTGFFDEIVIMPSGNPPHKESTENYNSHRLEMCKLAAASLEGFTVSDMELKREGKIYSVDTFDLLQEAQPDCKHWLIIGTDSLMHLEQWYMPERLLSTVNFVVIDRGGHDLAEVQAVMKALDRDYRSDFMYVPMPLIELSSTSIRQRIAKGLSVQHMVPDLVNAYIEEHGLYGSQS